MTFINPPIGPTDPDDIAAAALQYLADNLPGYIPHDGNPEVWIIMACARMCAVTGDVASAVPRDIYRDWGQTILGLQPNNAIAATVTSTWTMVDDAGYTIPAGTQVGFQVSGNEIVVFTTVDEVIVPEGATVTDVGAVLCQAVVAGTAANALPADKFVLIDALSYVDSVSAVSASGGGADAETDAQYISRLIAEVALFTPTPILGSDFGVMARNVAGVYRAVGIDNYNPDDDTDDNERMVAVAVIGSDGLVVSTPVKDAVQEYLESIREVNFICNVFDPEYTTIDVDFDYTIYPGYSASAVLDAATAALASYLSPATWGVEFGDDTGTTWENNTTVRYNEIVALLNNVEGLQYVSDLTINGGDVDVVMTGKVALPLPGSFTGTMI
jgi:hypothetical protein